MLASVGTPGEASAVEHVEAFVGSSAEPNPSTAPANEPVAAAIALARTREFEVEALDRLASALADGPDVVGVGADPSGDDGSGGDAVARVGTVARVPGAVADDEPFVEVPGAALFELEAVTGSVEATLEGPTLPGLADADPPAVEPSVPGWTTGCAKSAGPSASAGIPVKSSSARRATSARSFLMS